MKREAGFSLIELMVVVVILGILATVSIPAYINYLKNSRETEAEANLAALTLLAEEYNSLYGRYCPACTDTNPHTYNYIENDTGTATTDTITNWLKFTPKQATTGQAVRYNYEIVAQSNTDYHVTATPVTNRGATTDVFILTELGEKYEGDDPPGATNLADPGTNWNATGW